MAGRIPIWLVTGYLGAGKTTLLNRLLAEPDGRRIAVLVNDFGSVDVDAALIAAHDGTTISMANGCACCTIGDDLGAAILRVQQLGTFDRIVIEASGVADPARLADWALVPGLALDAIVVLADATTVARRAGDRYVGDTVRRQLAAADVLVLTKIDLADEPTSVAAESLVRSLAPGAVVVRNEGSVAVAVLRDPGPSSRTVPGHPMHEHHDEVHCTATTSTVLAVDRAGLRVALSGAPGLVRAKGIVRCPDRDGTLETLLVQADDSTITIDDVADTTEPTGLVLIGVETVADLDRLRRDLSGT